MTQNNKEMKDRVTMANGLIEALDEEIEMYRDKIRRLEDYYREDQFKHNEIVRDLQNKISDLEHLIVEMVRKDMKK